MVPVLAALGVTDTGQKRLLAMQLAASEAAASWGGLLAKLQQRGLPAPLLVVTDGHAGLKKALETWPTARVQRCTAHKGRNLADACPVHARPELRRDYHRLLYATDGLAARAAYDAFLKKWTPLCPPVARSLEEAGLELLTFYTFPKAMWKSLRTTNALENLNREFRRRTKTQASFSTEAAALTVLFGLVAVGQIVFRKIDGLRTSRPPDAGAVVSGRRNAVESSTSRQEPSATTLFYKTRDTSGLILVTTMYEMFWWVLPSERCHPCFSPAGELSSHLWLCEVVVVSL